MGAIAALVAHLGPIGIIIDTIVGVIVIAGIFPGRAAARSRTNVVSEVADSGLAVKIKRNPKPKKKVTRDRLVRVPPGARFRRCSATVVVVARYSLGIRLLTVSGRTPIVTPAEFTDAITVITPAEAKAAAKRAAKAAKKSPLSDGQKRAALVGAWRASH